MTIFGNRKCRNQTIKDYQMFIISRKFIQPSQKNPLKKTNNNSGKDTLERQQCIVTENLNKQYGCFVM